MTVNSEPKVCHCEYSLCDRVCYDLYWRSVIKSNLIGSLWPIARSPYRTLTLSIHSDINSGGHVTHRIQDPLLRVVATAILLTWYSGLWVKYPLDLIISSPRECTHEFGESHGADEFTAARDMKRVQSWEGNCSHAGSQLTNGSHSLPVSSLSYLIVPVGSSEAIWFFQ